MTDSQHPKRDTGDDGPVFYDIHQAPAGTAGMFLVSHNLTQAEVDSIVAAWRKRYGDRPSIVPKSMPYASHILPEEKGESVTPETSDFGKQNALRLWEQIKATPEFQASWQRSVSESHCEPFNILPEEKVSDVASETLSDEDFQRLAERLSGGMSVPGLIWRTGSGECPDCHILSEEKSE